MSGVAMKSLEWTFLIKPIRRYDLTKGQDPRVERDLCIPNVLLDSFDLFFNQRGVGWSWSAKPFPRWDTPPPSIALVIAKLLVKLTALDTAQYLIQLVLPTVGKPGGGSIFDPTLNFFPRMAVAAFAAICGGVWAWALLDTLYHIASLIGRVIFRQPASVWPPYSRRPWLATSLREFWSYRWHQLLRHVFTVFGARPGGALFGEPGAVMGAFAVSAIIHHIAYWGLGCGADFMAGGAFFVFMGVGAVLEGVFKKATGLRIGGLYGWLWTMLWLLVWGTLMMDGWAKGGVFAGVYFPDRYRPGKTLINTTISLSTSEDTARGRSFVQAERTVNLDGRAYSAYWVPFSFWWVGKP